MTLSQILERMKASDKIQRNLTAWREIPAREGRFRPFPSALDPRLAEVLSERGIDRLYSHQAEAFSGAEEGRSCVVVTPTASGKTLCYNLPVLNRILSVSATRALYLFPTKALSQDQVAELQDLVGALGEDIKTYTYDGDTPPKARKSIRRAGHIVVTNPDMLHTAILPHHTKWTRLFENLRFVVIDELHSYRGIFGSHVANVIRRLKRICRFYGARPIFICSSATIANPKELAAELTGEDMVLIDRNGAPRGKKHFLFYNPPVVNKELGIRRSSTLEVRDLAELFLQNRIQTLIFTRSRINTEILVTYLKESLDDGKFAESIRGYRGGYLPRERRKVEAALRSGELLGVVSTNALELGIDIGQLEACIINGYPGSISSTWQQAGRAGRGTGEATAILVATSSPLDQYIINNPRYFFEQNPEHGLINPDNLIILLSHIKCAAFELPFRSGEKFGGRDVEEILEFLSEERVLHRSGDRWHWMAENFPAEDISLRSASSENFIVIDTTDRARVIGEVDRFSAPMMIHEDAIYIHDGQQYHIDRLDWEAKKAYARQVDVDYYTDANLAVEVRVLEEFERDDTTAAPKSHGEVMISAQATMFKKIKFHTHENIGSGPISLPEEEMHTSSYWFALPREATERLTTEQIEGGLLGIANLLVNVAPLYLMCDPGDIRAVSQIRAPFTGRPTLFIYDSYPGGVGFSEKLFRVHDDLLETAGELLEECDCSEGCPSCVGPLYEVGTESKDNARRILRLARRKNGEADPP